MAKEITALELSRMVRNGATIRHLDDGHGSDEEHPNGMEELAAAMTRLADAQTAMAQADEARSKMLSEVVMTLQKVIHTRAAAVTKAGTPPDELKTILSQVEAMQAVTREPNPIYTFKITRHTSGQMRGFADTIQAIPSPPPVRYDS